MILETIVQSTRRRVAQKKAQKPLAQIREEACAFDKGLSFPFETALAREGINFICELKKASPSRGIIASDYPYRQIAREYEQGGAAAISVLTEPDYFLGDDRHLADVQKTVSIPLLRKDFFIDEYQIYEAKALGASAVLLIADILDGAALRDYIALCHELGLSALVETHDAQEVEAALQAGARIIGVNNRNLRDFSVDINNALRLRKMVPDTVLFVAESGIKTAAEVARLREAGVNGILIGEALMLSSDKGKTLQNLRGDNYD
jgi:indole-3-glycerol phosphate synthase